MQTNETWIAMFRRIPADLHDSIALGLATGAEIVVKKILRLEPDFMIIRGRLAGTNDIGRIVMIAYHQLTFAALAKPMNDAEIEAIFGNGAPVVFAETPATTPASPTATYPGPEATTVSEAPAVVNPAKKTDTAPVRSALLAKLRDRLKEAPVAR